MKFINFFFFSYIDPNTGGTIFQFLLPFISAIGAGIIIFWRRIKGIFLKIIGKSGEKEE